MTESITFLITYKEVPATTRLVLVDDEAHDFIEDDYMARDVCGLVRRLLQSEARALWSAGAAAE